MSYTTWRNFNLSAGIMDGIPIIFPTGGFNGGRLKVNVCVGAFYGGFIELEQISA